jgi:hypothetical protein
MDWHHFSWFHPATLVVDLRLGEGDRGPAYEVPGVTILHYPQDRSALLELLCRFPAGAALRYERLAARHEMLRREYADRTAGQERPKITAAYPEAMAPWSWATLEVFLYLRDYRELVGSEIRRLQDREDLDYSAMSSELPRSLPAGCPIRVCLQSSALRCNPSETTIHWHEPYNRLPFRISPLDQAKDGYSASLDIDLFADDLPVASMRPAIAVNSQLHGEQAKATADAAWYEDIFASYAREDLKLVRHLKERYEALGLYLFVHLDDLRSGDLWRAALFRRIDESDLFQLFWSEHARRSKYVAAEWQHALRAQDVKGGRFIRPVYWEDPMPPIPEELAQINFRRIRFVNP